jgi:ubiquinone/menaquinone biosynthesis C-methylase UbiE
MTSRIKSSFVSLCAQGIFPHHLSWLLDNPVRRLLLSPENLLEKLELPDTGRVLEVGPGSGFLSVALAKRLSHGEIVLLDLQPDMLAKAKRKLDSLGFQHVRYVTADVSDGLPYPDGYFDLVLLVCVLGEVRDRRGCLRALRRVLRSDGILAIHESLPDPDMLSFDHLLALVQAEGFSFSRRWGRSWNYTATFQPLAEDPVAHSRERTVGSMQTKDSPVST